MGSADLPIIPFQSAAAWETWLGENHDSSPGIWLQFAKKSSGIESVTYTEAVDSALCFGWIDGQVKSFDQLYFLQRFTPRRPRSKWSQVNTKRVEELIAKGRMRPAGQRQIDAAKQDGRWARAYASPSQMTVPADFQKCLNENPDAQEFFKTLSSMNRYAILYRIDDAQRPETRIRRIEKFIAMLKERKTIY